MFDDSGASADPIAFVHKHLPHTFTANEVNLITDIISPIDANFFSYTSFPQVPQVHITLRL